MRRRAHSRTLRSTAWAAAVASLVCVAGACASGVEDPVLGDILEGSSELDSRPVVGRAHSELEEAVRTVIRDRQAWERFLEDAVGPDARDVETPGFGDRMVVVAAMGRRPTGGFQLRITGVYSRNDSILVGVQHLLPGRNCIVTQAVTSPFEALSVPAREGPVRFIVEERTLSCSR